MLQSSRPAVQLQGAYGLSLKGPEARPAVPRLTELLKSNEARVRQNAALALGKIGPDARHAVPALTEALKDKEWNVRRQAAVSLGEIGPAAKDAAPELREAMKDTADETILVQRCAALALLRITEKEDTRAAFAVLAKAMEVKNVAMPDPVEKEVHERAKKALAKGGSSASRALVDAYKASLLGPAEDKKEARKTALQHLVSTFFNGSAEQAMAALLELKDSELTEEQLDRIQRLINEARTEGR